MPFVARVQGPVQDGRLHFWLLFALVTVAILALGPLFGRTLVRPLSLSDFEPFGRRPCNACCPAFVYGPQYEIIIDIVIKIEIKIMAGDLATALKLEAMLPPYHMTRSTSPS